MRMIGIFGGSFDPIHLGHQALAEAALKEASLDKIVFMHNHVSPFNQNTEITSSKDRCGMIEKIVAKNSAFVLSRFEIDKKGPSYTYNTLIDLEKKIDGKLIFILGFDSVLEIDHWYKGQEILRHFPLITGRRPGVVDDIGMGKIEFYRKKYDADIRILTMSPFECSSTDIRKRVTDGLSLDGLVSPLIEKYIKENGLYKTR